MPLTEALKTGNAKQMYKIHSKCRVCDSNDLVVVLDLGTMPLANDFCEAGQERAGFVPLKLMWCPRCTLGQLSVTVNPEVLYKNYPYVTSQSQTMKEHFASLCGDLMAESKCATAIEIGSNDGTLLKYLMDVGIERVLGIEPAKNLAKLATEKGVPTWNAFFDNQAAVEAAGTMPNPGIILARHVFCHIDDWHEAINSLGVMCGKDTVVVIEVPYFLDTIKNVEWDQVYHEHLSYMTIKAMDCALRDSMLHIHNVKHYPIHGGAIAIMLRRNDCEIEPKWRIGPADEICPADLKSFSFSAYQEIHDLSEKVREIVNGGRTVVGYGASAKATQWIMSCGFNRKHIKWVCDCTPSKMYKMMPGTDIPVVDPGALTRDLPDFAVCFAWNFFEEIYQKEKIFLESGGKWLIPHKGIKIV